MGPIYFWFECKACKYNGIRYCNTKTCPTCRAKPLIRHRKATAKEKAAQLDEAAKKWREIPD
jgi:DnaJ-class molecular chaperone